VIKRLPLRVPIAVALSTLVAGCTKYQSVLIARATTFRPNRPLTLTAPEPLVRVGSTNQICLEVQRPDSLLDLLTPGWGIRRSDGVIVHFGAALLHADGTADTLSSVGSSTGSTDCVTLGPSVTDTLHPPFTAVRITASDSLAVAAVWWSSTTGW
jgi:hypothetical protein